MTTSTDEQLFLPEFLGAKGGLPEVVMEAKPYQSGPDLDVDPTVPERMYWRDESRFCAMISLGAIVPGHSLICPTLSLVRSTGGRSLHDIIAVQSLGSAFLVAVKSVQTTLEKAYGRDVVFFEHGNHRSTLCPSRCGTAFPHLHAIPETFTIAKDLGRASHWRYEAVVKHEDLNEFYSSRRGPGEYVVISDREATIAIWSGEDRSFPSQLLRHATQAALSLPINDWQDDRQPDSAIREAQRLRFAHPCEPRSS